MTVYHHVHGIVYYLTNDLRTEDARLSDRSLRIPEKATKWLDT